ncbi:hypothetical protein ACROYT_G038088 [Oculina patagonica]
MGQSLSQVIEGKERDKKFEEALELRKIERTMSQKFEEKKATLYIDALNDECLPIVCAVDKFHEFLFDVKKPQITSGSTEPEDLYGIGRRMKKHLQGDYLKKLMSLLGGVVGNVLDTQTIGVVEEKQTHVVYANMSVIRIDYYLYYTRFSVGSDVMTALFYYVQVGVIDMTRVRLPVLIYELTRATEYGVLGNAGEALKGIADSSIRLHEAVQTLANAARQKAETGGSIGSGPPPSGGLPPSVARQQGTSPPGATPPGQ